MELNDFLEMDTPIFKKIVGMEPYLDPFIVSSPSGEEKGYLITSPEYSLKMLLSTGLEKIYEITHSFRSKEKCSPIHSAEFLMLEFYSTSWDEFQMMEFIIQLFQYLDENYYNFGMDRIPIKRMSNDEVFKQFTGRGWERYNLEITLHENRIGFHPDSRYEDIFYLVFLNLVEPRLDQGILFLYDYPPDCGALAKVESGVARRFEIYWDGVELANSFYELTDSNEQRRRLENEREIRRTLGKEEFPLDEDFLRCLEIGIPDGTGISIGLDRLLMKIMGSNKLREVSPYFG